MLTMSGHSKWSTIKHKKEITDSARGKVFSKLSRAISIAVKTGGSNNPATNYKLKLAIDAARAANMPKINIEKALSKAETSGDLVEIRYEGFAPGGAGIIVEAATDNRNRTAQVIKQIFEKGGGQVVNPGAVAFDFETTGLIIVEKTADVETQMLELIEVGAKDIVETPDGIEVYIDPHQTSAAKDTIEKNYTVLSMSLIQKPKMLHEVTDESSASKVVDLLSTLEESEDVQEVYTNAHIPDSLLEESR